MSPVADNSNGGGRAERKVHRAFQMIADVAFVDQVDVGLDEALGRSNLRLVGDVAKRSADRSGAEQGALRAAQSLDAVEVEQVEIGGAQRQGDDGFVEVDADLLLDARLV